ncbi:hypothetical protein [Lacinutrix chionoecetis]
MKTTKIIQRLFLILFVILFECKSDDDNQDAPIAEICSNGLDDDNDGFIDCDDFDCENFECNCNDSIDNDGDGSTDCDDSDCAGREGC